jgi:hypothetical protein
MIKIQIASLFFKKIAFFLFHVENRTIVHKKGVDKFVNRRYSKNSFSNFLNKCLCLELK